MDLICTPIARVDTRPPQIDGTTNGTPGENGWYISPVTVSASASDPAPGSGIQALTYALGGAWTPYTEPLTLSDGEHTLTFRAADRAGHSAEASLTVRVDTQPPALQTALDGEQANGWYLSRATFTASASDSGSGLARLEYAADGEAWQPYTAPVTFGDGVHSLRLRAFDLAGNVAEAAPLTFQVDGAPPRIRLTDAWYIWENGTVQVNDEQSGLAGVEIEIRDPQGRWRSVSRAYETNGETFETTIAWDRRFADGVLAPIGTYDVLVKAFDRAGNAAQETARILIPAPNATLTPLPTRTPQPTATPTASGVFSLPAQPAPTATRTASLSAFQSPNLQSNNLQSNNLQSPNLQSNNLQSHNLQSSAPLFGAAALTAIAAATALALAERKRRKDEEARQTAEAQRKAAARNAAEALQKIQNWLIGQQIKKQQEETSTRPPLYPDPETADMTEAERLAQYKQSVAYQARQERYRQWEAQQTYQAYRAGEQASYEPAAQPRSWWQRAGEAITHPVQTLENVLVDWGSHSRFGYKVISGLAHLTAPMNDPERNPVTAAFGKALRAGIDGFVYGVRSTLNLERQTVSSLLTGDWDGVKRYGGALAEGVVKGWIWGGIQTVGHLAWGVVKTVTPIGLFETGPAWWQAIKDRWAGKRGGWDVALTSLFLMANLLGIAGAANGVQTQVTRTALIREYGEPVRPLLAEREVIPLLRNGEPAPKPWTEYVPVKYQEKIIPAFDGQFAIAVKLNDFTTVYRYWGGESPETGPWVTVYRNLSPSQARSLLALPNKNPATNITEFGIPKDVVIIVGKAASQASADWAGSYAVGGGIQIYVPDPSVLMRFP